MFHRLWHRAIIGRHHQQREIDCRHTRNHVADESFMAGNVDKTKHSAAIKRLVGEAQVDGQTARLLFRQTIGVDAG